MNETTKETSTVTWATTGEVARRVGLTVWTLYDLIRNGVIPAPVRTGKTYLWATDDVQRAEAYVAKRKGDSV